jgi:hypothetical protein
VYVTSKCCEQITRIYEQVRVTWTKNRLVGEVGIRSNQIPVWDRGKSPRHEMSGCVTNSGIPGESPANRQLLLGQQLGETSLVWNDQYRYVG